MLAGPAFAGDDNLGRLAERNCRRGTALVESFVRLALRVGRATPADCRGSSRNCTRSFGNAIRNACEALPPAGGLHCVRRRDRRGSSLLGTYPACHSIQPGRMRLSRSPTMAAEWTKRPWHAASTRSLRRKKPTPAWGCRHLPGIVRGHRGAVHVESAVGQGTTVRILLPVARDSQTLAGPVADFLPSDCGGIFAGWVMAIFVAFGEDAV